MHRAAAAALACAALGCARPAPSPPAPAGSAVRPAEAMEITGLLTRKGPDETSFWAVTDGSGKVWEIVEVTPQLDARFRALQNATVTLRVERKGRMVLEQVRVLDVVRPAPWRPTSRRGARRRRRRRAPRSRRTIEWTSASSSSGSNSSS